MTSVCPRVTPSSVEATSTTPSSLAGTIAPVTPITWATARRTLRGCAWRRSSRPGQCRRRDRSVHDTEAVSKEVVRGFSGSPRAPRHLRRSPTAATLSIARSRPSIHRRRRPRRRRERRSRPGQGAQRRRCRGPADRRRPSSSDVAVEDGVLNVQSTAQLLGDRDRTVSSPVQPIAIESRTCPLFGTRDLPVPGIEHDVREEVLGAAWLST